jgi:predicted esterase
MQPARFSRSAFVLTASTAALLLVGCTPAADSPGDAATSSGGASPSSSGGQSASGGSPGSGGGSGGQPSSASGGNTATGGSTQQGTGGGPSASGGAASGGRTATGGAAMGGRGGSAAGSGGAAGGASGMKNSAGCGTTTTQALNKWVESMVTSGGSSRPYSVRLPTGYSASRAYPVIVLLHGCGGGTNNVPMENATGTDAILVRGTGSAADTCWTTAANSADITFFDAMVADTKARFCADENRFFVVGYSSGSWLANQLTCIRSSVLRGAATVTGGESAGSGCKGPVSRIFIHDKDDTTNVISGSEKARDRQLTQNGCDKSMQPVAQDPSPCVGYPGCPAEYPVVWCATSGQMHNRQDSFAPSTFWNFFKKF